MKHKDEYIVASMCGSLKYQRYVDYVAYRM